MDLMGQSKTVAPYDYEANIMMKLVIVRLVIHYTCTIFLDDKKTR
jgi:hypothetical protein